MGSCERGQCQAESGQSPGSAMLGILLLKDSSRQKHIFSCFFLSVSCMAQN